MQTVTKKPTRRQLLLIIGDLQNMIGRAKSTFMNDRDPMLADKLVKMLDEAFALCIEARQFDNPMD